MQSTDRLGRFVVALALIGFGVENLLFGRYIVARIAPWPPNDQSTQMIVGAAGALVFLAGGVAMLMGRGVRLAGLASAVFILAYSMILHWPVAFAGPAWSGNWTNVFKAASLAAGMVAVAAADGRRMSGLLATLTGLAPYVLAAFFLLAGVQHFMFTDFVSTLVPPFIPAPHFWTYFAGVALLAAGLGLCTPRFRLLAAVCSAAMVFSWVFLVHVPLVFALGREEWMGVVEALGISGVCLAVAQPPAARHRTADPVILRRMTRTAATFLLSFLFAFPASTFAQIAPPPATLSAELVRRNVEREWQVKAKKMRTVLLPLMRKHNVDLWVIMSRENAPDPAIELFGGIGVTGWYGHRNAYLFRDPGDGKPLETTVIGTHLSAATSSVLRHHRAVRAGGPEAAPQEVLRRQRNRSGSRSTSRARSAWPTG